MADAQGRRLVQFVDGKKVGQEPEPEVNPVILKAPEPAVKVSVPVDNVDALTKLQDQVAQLVSIVSVQQKTFQTLQEDGLRVSDAQAIRDERLAVQAHMGPAGFVVELNGPWSMGHINQLRLAMRSQMQQDAIWFRQRGNQEALAHRKGATLPAFGEGE